MTKVTVYIPCLNYAHFLDEAIGSVVAQSYANWEMVIINDGSTDETAAVAEQWACRDARISLVVHEAPRGLPACANEALALAKGEYIMRLDADDYLDENAFLVLVNFLDQHPDVALVYPNFVHVSTRGRYLSVEHRKRIGKEARLLDLPAHGACTMVRRSVLEFVSGYSESQDRQDGYDLWLKVIGQFPVANVETPLFYYRHHGPSLSGDEGRLLEARRRIKRAAVNNGSEATGLGCCVAVILAKNTYNQLSNIVFAELGGRPLIDFTLDAALAIGRFDAVLVSTDDERVASYATQFNPRVRAYVRPKRLSRRHTSEEEVLRDAVLFLEQEEGISPDTIVSLAVNCPLRGSDHIQEALDTLTLFGTDMVISVYEDYDLHFVHGSAGLETLNPAMHMQIRLEREALYVWNGAVRIVRRTAFGREGFFGASVGHIVMGREESIQIKTEFDKRMVESVLSERDGIASGGVANDAGRVVAKNEVRR